MPFLDYFRNFFGGRVPPEPNDERTYDRRGDRFRNPIWQIGEDDDDVDDFRRPGGTMHFSIFTDPLEITRYFETQMDTMMKEFFHGIGNNSEFFAFPDSPQMNALPPPPKHRNLRDIFLKDGDSGFEHSDTKIDQDLDGKITPDDLTIWKNKGGSNEMQPFIQQHSFGKSVRKEIFRRPDGTVEHKQIIRDSDGNEETIISRQIGDKKYTVTTKRDKNGIETKTEDLINMDESDLKFFSDKWTPLENDSMKHSSILSSFPWEKLFGPNPKL